jgi:lysophospholipase L1-like esterase
MIVIKYLKHRIGYLSYAIFLALVLSIFYACTHPKRLSQSSRDTLFPKENTVIRYHTDWAKINYPVRINQFKKDTLHVGEIIFLGNSLTELGGDWNAKFGTQNIHNRGIAGDVTEGVLIRLDEIIDCQPKAVFLLIGINDVYNLLDKKQIPSAAYIANNIVTIAKKIHAGSPQANIYVQTILPTAKPYLKDSIRMVNKIIQQQAQQGFYTVIDLHAAFVNEQGLMQATLTTDSTHLTESGYNIWTNIIRSIVIENSKKVP